jgi:AraC-like DNA-binding protein
VAAGPGDAVFVVKGLQRVFRVAEDDFCALLIFMPDEFIETVIRKNRIRLSGDLKKGDIGPVIPLDQDEVLSVYATSLLNYFSQAAPPSKNLLKLRFEELIIHLLAGKKNPLLAACFRDLCAHRKSSLREIMETHFVYNLKLTEYARLSGCSLATFKREFHKVYQTSPGKWLKSRRLEYSTYLLESTDLNINQITLECGFKNTSHFIRSFREKYKRTPLEFRKQGQLSDTNT